jgi:hypothetical protein
MNKILLIVISSLIVITSCSSGQEYTKEQVNSLATCLVDKGVLEYGAFWCPTCAKQAKLFGDSDSIIKQGVYVECDPRCDVPINDLPKACKGQVGYPAQCLNNDVDKYPNWQFPDGQKLVGAIELSVLAETAGCTL